MIYYYFTSFSEFFFHSLFPHFSPQYLWMLKVIKALKSRKLAKFKLLISFITKFYRNFTDDEKLMHFNGIYDHVLVHLGPYLLGIFYGYCTYNFNRKIKINSLILAIGKLVYFSGTSNINSFLGWTTSVILVGSLMFSSYKINSINRWFKYSFTTLSHTFWTFVLLWFCFASAGRKGKFD